MKSFVLILILTFVSYAGIAQPAISFPVDNRNDAFNNIGESQVEYLDSIYLNETGLSKMFINGRGYVPYYVRSQNKPVLRYKEDRTSSLVFDGRRFDDIVLQYDTFKDQVVYTDKTLIYNNILCQVALSEENVSQFELYFQYDTLNFRYFSSRKDSAFSLNEGFYEVVYENTCKFLIKHVSSRNAYDVTDEYNYAPVSYLNLGEGYFPITTKSRFINMFGDDSDEIRGYIKAKRIKFKKAGKEQIAAILRFYESLGAEDI